MEQVFYKENYYALAMCVLSNENLTVDKALRKMDIEVQIKDYKNKEIDKEELERLYNVEMKTQREISEIFDTTQARIEAAMKKYGIRANEEHMRNMKNHYKIHNLNKEEIYDLYWNKGMGTKQIGEILGVHCSTVRKFMLKNDIKLRARGSQKKVENEECI